MSRPIGPGASGLLREEMLMWSPAPAKQSSAPKAQLSPKCCKAGVGGRIPENGNLGFPQLGERKLWLSPHPRPKCQVSSRGGGGLQSLIHVQPRLQSQLSPRAADAARAHIHTNSHSGTFTHSHACTHTLRHVSKSAAQTAAGHLHFLSFAAGGARGAGLKQRRN